MQIFYPSQDGAVFGSHLVNHSVSTTSGSYRMFPGFENSGDPIYRLLMQYINPGVAGFDVLLGDQLVPQDTESVPAYFRQAPYRRQYDEYYFGSLMNHLAAVAWDKRNVNWTRKENGVVHAQYRGRLATVGSISYFGSLNKTTQSVYGFQLPRVGTFNARLGLGVNYATKTLTPSSGPLSLAFLGSTEDILHIVESQARNDYTVNIQSTDQYTVGVPGVSWYRWVFKECSYELDDFGIHISYVAQFTRWNNGVSQSSDRWYSATVQTSLSVPWPVLLPYRIVPISGTAVVTSFPQSRQAMVYRHFHTYNYGAGYAPGLDVASLQLAKTFRFNPGLTFVGTVTKATSSAVVNEWVNRRETFRRHVEKDLVNLWPACYYSAAKAFDGYVSTLPANHIETLSELKATLGLHHQTKELVKLAASSVIFRNMLDRGIRLVDAVTRMILLGQYALRPLITSASDVLEKSDVLLDKLQRESYGTRTLHGKHIIDTGVPYRSVVARSKIRYKFDTGNVILGLLGADSIGLLPRFSSLWETIRLSFLLDMVTSVNSHLKAAETRVLMLSAGCGMSVHSLEVFADIDITGYVSLYDPHAKYYVRTVSKYLPPIKESVYDLLPPPGLRLDMTTGSLAFQLLKF